MDETPREKGTRYRSYLLRLWQTTDGDRKVWHASLEQPGTGRRQGFAGLPELLAFLEHEIDVGAAVEGKDDALCAQEAGDDERTRG